MPHTDPAPGLKEVMHQYLRDGRAALLWKLDGLSEPDARRPLTPTGSNILGIIKHVAAVEVQYFGPCFGREHGLDVGFLVDPTEENEDMFAQPGESIASITQFYQDCAAHTDATIDALDLATPGYVPFWNEGKGQEVTLGYLLTHMIAETHRHAGHVDILREQIDEKIGWKRDDSSLWEPQDGWAAYRVRLQMLADSFQIQPK